jgi:flagellar export protein FliJ
MSLFKFPLQRLLDLRAKRQDEIARQLAQARTAADNSRATRDDLAAARTAGQAQLTEAHASGPTVGEIASRSYALTQLDQRIAAASDALNAAEAHVDKVHGALTDAVKDKQVLDRLRDRMLEAYRSTESNKDRTAMDAIALQRFSQSNGSNGAADKNGEQE